MRQLEPHEHICTVRLVLPEDRRDEGVAVLRSLIGPVRSQPGCSCTELMRDIRDDHVVTWVSRWRTHADLERHLRSGHFRRILAILDLAAEPPGVEFVIGSGVRGLDLVEEVLGAGAGSHKALKSGLENEPEKGVHSP